MSTDDTVLVARLRELGTKECLDIATYLERASTPAGAQALFEDAVADARAQGDDPFTLYPPTADEMVAQIRTTALEIVSTPPPQSGG